MFGGLCFGRPVEVRITGAQLLVERAPVVLVEGYKVLLHNDALYLFVYVGSLAGGDQRFLQVSVGRIGIEMRGVDFGMCFTEGERGTNTTLVICLRIATDPPSHDNLGESLLWFCTPH